MRSSSSCPVFSEYQFYIANHGGRMVTVETDATFLPDVAQIEAAITPRTRAIILNTPNNPTGRVYPESVLRDLQVVLSRAAQPITVLSDEPYKAFVYDGLRQPEVASFIRNTAICNSWSKSLGLAGERIGYLALSPQTRGPRKPPPRLRLHQPHSGLYQCACHLAMGHA